MEDELRRAKREREAEEKKRSDSQATELRCLKRRLDELEYQEEARYRQRRRAQQKLERDRRIASDIRRRVMIEERERERIRKEIIKGREIQVLN